MFGTKLTPAQMQQVKSLAEQTVTDIHAIIPRPNSRKRLIAKQLLRERLLDHGIDASPILVDIAVESTVRILQLPLR